MRGRTKISWNSDCHAFFIHWGSGIRNAKGLKIYENINASSIISYHFKSLDINKWKDN